MKSTSPLRAFSQPALKAGQLSIHPNDGFDLGLMTTGYEVELEGTGRAEIRLRNECPKDSLELSPGLFDRLGKPNRVVLKYDGSRLYIEPR